MLKQIKGLISGGGISTVEIVVLLQFLQNGIIFRKLITAYVAAM